MIYSESYGEGSWVCIDKDFSTFSVGMFVGILFLYKSIITTQCYIL